MENEKFKNKNTLKQTKFKKKFKQKNKRKLDIDEFIAISEYLRTNIHTKEIEKETDKETDKEKTQQINLDEQNNINKRPIFNRNIISMFILTFVLFNATINELLYNNFWSLQISWRYNTMLSAPIDIAVSNNPVTDADMMSIMKNDKVSLDSFKNIVIEVTKDLPKDTLFLNKCGKGQRNSYVAEKFRLLAIYMQLKYRIPSSVTLAQIIHETGHGTSKMFKHSNQLFGRKCFENNKSHWFAHKTEVEQLIKQGHKIHKGKHCNWYPDERDAFNRYNRFVNYDSYFDSAMDRYNVLLNPRYNKLFKQKDPLNPVTSHYKIWTKGLKEGGWATDKNYTKLLNNIISSNNFQVIDENVEKYRERLIKENGQMYFDKKLILYEYKIKLITNTNNL